MGTEDMRRQAPNVERMRLLGAEVAPVEAGARTLKEAVSAAIRDWVTNVATTHYIIGSAVGPAPYPALVRDLQRVIGDEAREQALAAEGGAAGPGDRLRRRRLELDRHLRPVPRRRGRADRGRGRRGGPRERPPRRLARPPGGPASCTARSRPCSPTTTVRSSRRTRSPPASTIPASARSTPSFATAAGSATSRSPTTEALAAFGELARLEGIIPALEPSHAWLCDSTAMRTKPRHLLGFACGGARVRRRPGRLRRPDPQRPRRQGPGRGRRAERRTTDDERTDRRGLRGCRRPTAAPP